MSELCTAVLRHDLYWEAFDSVKFFIEKYDYPRCDVWKLMRKWIEKARKLYASMYVDWFTDEHVMKAQKELADMILDDMEEN